MNALVTTREKNHSCFCQSLANEKKSQILKQSSIVPHTERKIGIGFLYFYFCCCNMNTFLFVCLFLAVMVEFSCCAVVVKRDTTSFRSDGLNTEQRNYNNKSSGLSPVQLEPGTKKKITTPNDVINSFQNLIQGYN